MKAEDVILLERELERMRKRWRGWRVIRWLIGGTGLMVVAVGVYVGFSAAHLRVGDLLIPSLEGAATRPVTRMELEVGMMVTVGWIGAIVGSMFQIGVGVWVLGYTLMNWRRQEVSEALARVLGEKLAEVKRGEGD